MTSLNDLSRAAGRKACDRGKTTRRDEMKCRIYDADCINAEFCAARDACCAGDPECTATAVAQLEKNLRASEDWRHRGCPAGEIVDESAPTAVRNHRKG